MGMRAVVTGLLLLIVTYSAHGYIDKLYEREPICISPVLIYEIVVRTPRIYTAYRYEGIPVTIAIKDRPWSYNRKEKSPT
jgi:hypothetical protein